MSGKALKFLTPEQVAFYEQNGYLVIENFVRDEQTEAMRFLANTWMEEFERRTDIPIHLFTTREDQGSLRNEYFQKSVHGIWPFFEEKAFDLETRKLKYPYKQSINKIGHELHETQTIFGFVVHEDRCRSICDDLGVTNAIVPQSMYILKEAKIGAEVSPHQDSTYLYSEKPSCTAFWVPLEDATEENGCLWVIPGSHKGEIKTRYRMMADGSGASFDPPIGNTWHVWPKELFTPLPAKVGSLVLLHGTLVHMSLENLSDKPRHVYTWHVVSGDSKFAADNWMGPGPFPAL